MSSSSVSRLSHAADLASSIGNTPLVELRRFSAGTARIFAKLEWFNPGGSVKDRVAAAMLDDAERRGVLRPGGTIVEPTSGNTGVALAMLAAVRGYRCVVVMPEGYGQIKARLMEALGAEVVRTPAKDLMSGAIQRARDLVAQTPNSYLPNQFENPVNPKIHYETTGPEIHEAAGGPIDAWVAGVGTTGTFTGVARFLLERQPRLLKVAVGAAGVDPGRRRARLPRRRRSRPLFLSADPRSQSRSTKSSRSTTGRRSRPAAGSRAKKACSSGARPAWPPRAPSESPSASGPARPSSRFSRTARRGIRIRGYSGEIRESDVDDRQPTPTPHQTAPPPDLERSADSH